MLDIAECSNILGHLIVGDIVATILKPPKLRHNSPPNPTNPNSDNIKPLLNLAKTHGRAPLLNSGGVYFLSSPLKISQRIKRYGLK